MSKNKIYWISFADKENLGVCLIEDVSGEQAVKKSKDLGIHPGGEAMTFEMEANNNEIQGLEYNRLYSPSEMDARGSITKGLTEEEKLSMILTEGVNIFKE